MMCTAWNSRARAPRPTQASPTAKLTLFKLSSLANALISAGSRSSLTTPCVEADVRHSNQVAGADQDKTMRGRNGCLDRRLWLRMVLARLELRICPIPRCKRKEEQCGRLAHQRLPVWTSKPSIEVPRQLPYLAESRQLLQFLVLMARLDAAYPRLDALAVREVQQADAIPTVICLWYCFHCTVRAPIFPLDWASMKARVGRSSSDTKARRT